MKEKRYSVLMSVYYKEKPEFLRISIDSMLNQTISPNEFIIVKDGPLSKELDDVIDRYVDENPKLFTIIQNKVNEGLGPSLAKGILASKNSLIARMDSDDYSINNRCEKQLKEFDRDDTLEMVGSFEAEFIDDIKNVISVHRVPENDDEIRKFMRRRCAILHPTVMYKKEAVIKSGNYRAVHLYEDYDLFARMVLEHNVKTFNIQENLYYIRTSEEFFKRRGGVKYAQTVLKFKWGQYKKGYMSFRDFIFSGLGQAIVCLMPNSMRKWFYMTFLR